MLPSGASFGSTGPRDAAGPFGAALREARAAAGMTQEDLAAASGVSLRSVSDLERGLSQRPRRDTIAMLADALGLDPAARSRLFLLGGRGEGGGAALRAGLAAAAQFPAVVGPLLGREGELDRLLAAIDDPAVRLLTVTGPGGVGKTRLAVEAAGLLRDRGDRFVGWLSLDAIADPSLVAPAAEAALAGMGHDAAGERERPLLVLDNLEHLLDGALGLPRLLAAFPAVTVLATSRAPLRLQAERLLPLAPLPTPPDLDALPEDAAAYPSVALFLQRAAAARPDLGFDAATAAGLGALASAAAICARLDGLPLAIELAAGQLGAMSLPAMAALLDRAALGVLGGGPADRPARHVSMRDAVAWGYDLLDPADRALLRWLAVFRGGFTPAAALQLVRDAARRLPPERSAGLPASEDALLGRLAGLAAASMLVPAEGADPRFGMLETIRAYGLERLAEDPAEEAAVRAAHLAGVRALAGRWRPGMSRRRLNAWLDELEREIGNVRAALQWTLDGGDLGAALGLVADLGRLWDLRDYLAEGMHWLDRVIDEAERQDRLEDVPAIAWYWVGTLALPLGDPGRCREMGRRLEAIAGRDGDAASAARGAILTSLWHSERGEHAAAVRIAHEAVSRTDAASEGEPDELLTVRARAYNRLGVACHTEAEQTGAPESLACAADAYGHALRLTRLVGDESGTLNALAGLGAIALQEGDAESAAGRFARGVRIGLPNRHWWYAWLMISGMAGACQQRGDPAAGARLLGAAEALGRRYRFQPYAFWTPIVERAAVAAEADLGADAFAAETAAGRAAVDALWRDPDALLALLPPEVRMDEGDIEG